MKTTKSTSKKRKTVENKSRQNRILLILSLTLFSIIGISAIMPG